MPPTLPVKFVVNALNLWDENLVIMCCFYVTNCIFVHMINKYFPVTGPPLKTPTPTGPQSGGARIAPAFRT